MAIVLYARKSVERENSVSCETQLTYCRAMIKPDEEGEQVLTFVDNGFSGGNMDRAGFQKMMGLVRKNKVSKVIVYKLDRISRSLYDFVGILREFKAHMVEFVSSQESFDTASPYGEMIVKLLMVFAEFERTSIINRVTQAYAYRSEMGLYMGGRRPYGFELVPAVIHGVRTKKLRPIPEEMEQVLYIFRTYAQEHVSLRRLQSLLVEGNRLPLNGSNWTTAKLSTMLKNPIYVKADADVYDYYDCHGVHVVSSLTGFTGEWGAQLYGHTKHRRDAPDWSDLKLVLMTHPGAVDSSIWLACQRKLEQNRQITNSYSSTASWLAGKVVCGKCGCTMTVVKGKPNRKGEIRRYFNCTGKSHKKACTGPKTSIYAQDLEELCDDCIVGKLSALKGFEPADPGEDDGAVNEIKLKRKSVEQAQRLLMDELLAGSFNDALLALANERAQQLNRERQALEERLQQMESRSHGREREVDFKKSWERADYQRKKEAATLMIHQIVIQEDGGVSIVWNL